MEGPFAHRNWRAQLAGHPEDSAHESPLYSDARFYNSVVDVLGPYVLLNTRPTPGDPGSLVPVLVLRFSIHIALGSEMAARVEPSPTGTGDRGGFVGGTPDDELAALIALEHGVRIAAAAPTRFYSRHTTEARGCPVHLGYPPPSLPQVHRPPVLPALLARRSFSRRLLKSYPSLHPSTALRLARAARSYQQAIWVADTEPSLAWLLLVSAAETAANEWSRLAHEPNMSPTELLERMRPDFALRLRKAADSAADGVLDEVGTTLRDVHRAQWKFSEFLIRYGLDAPIPRPTVGPIEWSAASMRNTLAAVYKYRSNALHGGEPVPVPMCRPPERSDSTADEVGWSERPTGNAYTDGGLWTKAELPINLHAFHHLVRTAIKGWWGELAEQKTAPR